ncbi:FAD-binding oxidoreductase [Paenibacillus athensensis]|uniref:FAD-binding oxidoreductase n=1 Tax=Paenibacillus athensensis TaxID=1967502 RepID=A0A4Y8Q5N5_9BACL|nr:FAD-binding oxidoreductase [Paenibacillus athensensis]MCD1259508.1 FAD-binding oxidoreductase [Paenibacillus athensensis]
MKLKLLALAALTAACALNYAATATPDQDPFLITDYSRLHPVKVERIEHGHEEEQLVELVKEARDRKLTISIAGQRHSQGGHTYYKDGLVVDMTPFNRILAVDPQRKTVRVQAGATWKDVQDAVNPYGLAVKTMQSQNIFTVGGSISINAHGRDIRNGSLIKSVESFRLLTADGHILPVSRTENADLFPLALGGYGLFGIILDVTLSLTDDELYRTAADIMTVDEYSNYFRSRVQADPDVRMHIARISVAPESFLTDMYAINYRLERDQPLSGHNRLQTKEAWVAPLKLLFQLNRSFDWGKTQLWSLQKNYFAGSGTLISRNNAMRSDSGFMEYRQAGSNDLLQEYFIPVDAFADFVRDMRSDLQAEPLNLLNITVRYVNEDREAALSYATTDMFALVCLFNVPLSAEDQAETGKGIRRILDSVLKHGGTYYLPYAAYPTEQQFHAAYPEYAAVKKAKDRWDPDRLFMNYFYEQYLQGE